MFRLSKKGRLFVGFFIGFCCPLFLQAQNLAIRLRTIPIDTFPSDSAFAAKALGMLSPQKWAYLVVYGTERHNNTQAMLQSKYFGLWYESNNAGSIVPKTAAQLARHP
jgi:hypothetical protein